MANGTVTLNGITDADLIVILQMKGRFPKEISFDPQKLTAQRVSPNTAQHYSDATLMWTGAGGLQGVIDILGHIQEKKTAAPVGD